jgi:hypothetical protein
MAVYQRGENWYIDFRFKGQSTTLVVDGDDAVNDRHLVIVRAVKDDYRSNGHRLGVNSSN